MSLIYSGYFKGKPSTKERRTSTIVLFISFNHIININPVFQGSLAYSRYKTAFLLGKELIFGKSIADGNVAVLAFFLNLQQDLKDQFSCIYSAVNHDFYLLQG